MHALLFLGHFAENHFWYQHASAKHCATGIRCIINQKINSLCVHCFIDHQLLDVIYRKLTMWQDIKRMLGTRPLRRFKFVPAQNLPGKLCELTSTQVSPPNMYVCIYLACKCDIPICFWSITDKMYMKLSKISVCFASHTFTCVFTHPKETFPFQMRCGYVSR